MTKTALFLAALAAAISLSGCGSDCKSLCNEWVDKGCCDASQCGGSSCCPTHSDCEDSCVQAEALADKAECGDELDAWNSCAADLSNICDDDTTCTCADSTSTTCGALTCEGGKCRKEFEKYVNCTAQYCAGHPNSALCH